MGRISAPIDPRWHRLVCVVRNVGGGRVRHGGAEEHEDERDAVRCAPIHKENRSTAPKTREIRSTSSLCPRGPALMATSWIYLTA